MILLVYEGFTYPGHGLVLSVEGRDNHYHSKVEAYLISVVAHAADCPLCCAMLAFHSAKAAITNGGLIYQR